VHKLRAVFSPPTTHPEQGGCQGKPGRLQPLVTFLRDSGYEVSTNYSEEMKAVLAFAPTSSFLGQIHRSLIVAAIFLKSKVPGRLL
jgi:hypothetical protein